MKNLNRLILTTLLVLAIGNVNAQDENNPWQLTIGVNAVDVFPVGEDAPQGDLFQEFYNVEDHWSILPSVSTISVQKYIDDSFSVGVTGSINRLDKWGKTADGTPVSVDNLMYYGLDGNVKYSLSNLFKTTKIEPFLAAGGGYTWIEEGAYNTFSSAESSNDLVGSGTLNGTVGLAYWFSDNIGLTAQSTYKHSFNDYLTTHFQHSVGVSFKFGGVDTDKDGIYDKHDLCPEVPGLEEFNGCPDTDGDGVEDSKDTCPNEAGLAEYGGCPDTDGDGVSDNNDTCPNEAGLKSLAGCPDADSDGLANAQDECPNEAGPVANNGCPWKDGDSDGVLDKDDNCPTEAGTVANNGCPEMIIPTEELQAQLTDYARTINFNLGKSDFQKSAYPTLQAISGILNEYPKANFVVEGHTDSTGTNENFNQLLSERRAEKVVSYLVENGVSADRLSSIGFGESSPIESNQTAAGRAANRRVEVKLAK
ncbi:OmpA family protein [Flavobacteriaceae bacterium]|jgi:OOP family OmpA-OmpF porin|nr:OmpA family protein [Flavobacteriaceae bacterium]MDC1259158.1 OmpA family protein [Flavobacteriaceae bacterium]MDG1384831.1 OmpA family protein [Flavobacteriaceae bacterium]